METRTQTPDYPKFPEFDWGSLAAHATCGSCGAALHDINADDDTRDPVYMHIGQPKCVKTLAVPDPMESTLQAAMTPAPARYSAHCESIGLWTIWDLHAGTRVANHHGTIRTFVSEREAGRYATALNRQ